MARHIIRQLSDMERRVFAPHIEAYRTYQALVQQFDRSGSLPGVLFDPDACCYYTELPDPPNTGPQPAECPDTSTPAESAE